MRGVVSSNKMTGVVAVTVEVIKIHPLYKKRLRKTKKFLAKVSEALNIGDEVEITEVRPQSRRVTFAVTKVYNRAEVLPEVKEEAANKEKKTPVKKEKEVEKETKDKTTKKEKK